MTGKEKCAHLRQLREEVARQHNIPYVSTPCTYQGDDCIGTCPKCEEELRYLTKALREKENRGEPVQPFAGWELLTAHGQPEDTPCPEDHTVGGLSYEIPMSETGIVEFEEPEQTTPEENPPVCPFCGSIQKPGMRFCTVCGALMDKKSSGAKTEPVRRCAKCGTPLPPADTLCLYCGFDPEKPEPGSGFEAWCRYLDARKAREGASPGSGIADVLRSPVRDQMDEFQAKVAEVMLEGDPQQILQLQRGLEEILRWAGRMETRSARERREREIWELQMQRTPGVMISDEDLKKRKKRKGWF